LISATNAILFPLNELKVLNQYTIKVMLNSEIVNLLDFVFLLPNFPNFLRGIHLSDSDRQKYIMHIVVRGGRTHYESLQHLPNG
jgi:hypothetical protein